MLSYNELAVLLKEEQNYSGRMRRHRDAWQKYAMYGGTKPSLLCISGSEPDVKLSKIEVLEQRAIELENGNLHLSKELAKYKESFESVVDELVVNWVGEIPEPGESFKSALHKLVRWNIQIENDPAVSESAYIRQQETEQLYQIVNKLVSLLEVYLETIVYMEDEFIRISGIQ